MRAPEFWRRDGARARLLAPLGGLYAGAVRTRRGLARPWRAPVPVLCVGNAVAGGSGKTPVALSVGRLLADKGAAPHFLTRGYGGRKRGPLRVEPGRHDAAEVGDEALLRAAVAPTWVARDRPAGARAAVREGAGAVVMDDGFQNPSLAKDLSLLVVDGAYGFGNCRVIPAGPLRERPRDAMARADAVVVMGVDAVGVEAGLAERLPVLRARLVPVPGSERLAGKEVVAFAGIGRPEKFFLTLRELGCHLAAVHEFAAHHRYGEDEIMRLVEEATSRGALAVTTAKDAARLPAAARAMVEVLEVAVEWEQPGALDRLLDQLPAMSDG